MFKKTLAAVVVAGALVFAGSAAAFAEDDYPADIGCTANPATIQPGATSVITCVFAEEAEGWTVELSVTGPGVVPNTLSSIAHAAATGTSTVSKVVTDGQITVNLLGPAVTASTPYLVEAVATSPDEKTTLEGSATVTVTPAAAPVTPGLPPTGGTVPAAAIWLGVGAIGIGGIAVAAAVARRRAANKH
ncbi:hypothetical protein [Microbacterium sp. SS28]|uniref:hypothetical protein n=1 Tax=Microbacterium sp. SS28 TaxID=2919948 RepID=UPI001FAA84E2|nr:hypothetical protein [Microbacterium sp. SS28]